MNIAQMIVGLSKWSLNGNRFRDFLVSSLVLLADSCMSGFGAPSSSISNSECLIGNMFMSIPM